MQMDSRRMCPHCRAFITIDDRICPYCHEEVGPRAADVRNAGSVIGGVVPRARFNTMLILLINAGLYVATVSRRTPAASPKGRRGLHARCRVAPACEIPHCTMPDEALSPRYPAPEWGRPQVAAHISKTPGPAPG